MRVCDHTLHTLVLPPSLVWSNFSSSLHTRWAGEMVRYTRYLILALCVMSSSVVYITQSNLTEYKAKIHRRRERERELRVDSDRPQTSPRLSSTVCDGQMSSTHNCVSRTHDKCTRGEEEKRISSTRQLAAIYHSFCPVTQSSLIQLDSLPLSSRLEQTLYCSIQSDKKWLDVRKMSDHQWWEVATLWSTK